MSSKDNSTNQHSLLFEQKIKDKVVNYADEYLDTLVTDDINVEFNNAMQEYSDAFHNYKQGHNEAAFIMLKVFGLFFAFILIIPFYWAFKKYKDLKANKENLINIREEKADNKLLVHKKIIARFDILNYANIIDKSLNTKNYGPITENVIRSFAEIESFNLDDTPRYNPYKTSWSTFDDRMILINLYNKKHITEQREYTGSRTVYYRIGDKTYSKIITASIIKPVEKVITNEVSYAYMQSCKELELRYCDKNSTRDKLTLENDEMNKYTYWQFNNEIQFRMIFTILAQENYLNELKHLNALKSIPYQYQFYKTSNFFFNADDIDQTQLFFSSIYMGLKEFALNPNCDIKWLKDTLKALIIENAHERFLSIIYLWMVPILQSENHTHIISRILSSEQENRYKNPQSRHYPYYVLNEILNHQFLDSHSPNINFIIDSSNINIEGVDLSYIRFNAKGFNEVRRVESVYAGGYYVDVPYIEYVEQNAQGDIGYSKVNDNFYYKYDPIFGIESTNIENPNILNLIRQNYNSNNKIIIRNGIIAWVATDFNNQNDMVKLIQILRDQSNSN